MHIVQLLGQSYLILKVSTCVFSKLYIHILVKLLNTEDYFQQSAQRSWEKADVSLIHLMKLG